MKSSAEELKRISPADKRLIDIVARARVMGMTPMKLRALSAEHNNRPDLLEQANTLSVAIGMIVGDERLENLVDSRARQLKQEEDMGWKTDPKPENQKIEPKKENPDDRLKQKDFLNLVAPKHN